LAFGATAAAIWSGHVLRKKEHDEAILDDALKVTVAASPVGDYSNPPDVKQAIGATVINDAPMDFVKTFVRNFRE
jgi:hypothetical protein